MDYLKPLEQYLKARELQQGGKEDEAAQALEGAFSSNKPNSFLRQNLDKALDESQPAGSLVLDGVYGEMKWIQRQTAKPRKSRE